MKKTFLLLLTLFLCRYSFAQIPATDFTINGQKFLVVRSPYTSLTGSFWLDVAKQGSPLFNNAPYPTWYTMPTDASRDVNGNRTDVVKVYDACRRTFSIARSDFISTHARSLTVKLYLKSDGTVFDIHYSISSEDVFTPLEILLLDTILKQTQFMSSSQCVSTNIVGMQMHIFFKGIHTDPSAFGLGPDWEGSRP